MTSPAHAHDHGSAQGGLAELLDLDAEVLGDHQDDVLGWVAAAVGDGPVRTVLDVGAGTGTGTFAVLERFPDAQVVALDVDPDMLAHLAARAADRGGHPAEDVVQVVAEHLGVQVQQLGEAALGRAVVVRVCMRGHGPTVGRSCLRVLPCCA